MELIDRGYMQELLLSMGERYPQSADVDLLPDAPGNKRTVNLAYLEEQGLIDLEWSEDLSRREPLAERARINARGIDFLKEDGGLSAILGVVTVRLHADTVRDLLLAKVEESAEEPTVKELAKKKIRELPADMIGSLAQKGLEAALPRIPGLARWVVETVQASF